MEKLAAKAISKVKVLVASRTGGRRMEKGREIGGGFLLSFGFISFPCLRPSRKEAEGSWEERQASGTRQSLDISKPLL